MKGYIQINDLSLKFQWGSLQKPIFDDLNLAIETGSFVTVYGSNGSGKSSFIKLLLGLISPDHGTVSINGQAVIPGYPKAVRSGQLAYLAQQIEELFFAETVEEELAFGYGRMPAGVGQWLKELELDQLSNRLIDSLSGGERQALALGQFIMNTSGLLLLDEPSSYLDKNRARVLKEYLLIKHQEGKTIIHVSQYPSERIWGTHVIDLDLSNPEIIKL